ncbi:monovalent cation/H+ antiporter subunit D family protein [Desulfocurvibacter africanus]|uniref:monovalent cation/H+ antiporter subunit D family protein n=1 Tax=Desulfocurvibacter africanus TaxID=873 RepID=UPI0004162850|nr:monovalent cation/H+ antiporter subunit D family protein [Desulfocurvibacter africanus]
MQALNSILPFLAVLAPLTALPGILSASRAPNAREAWTFFAALLMLGLVGSMVPAVLAGSEYYFLLAPVIPGAPLALRVDAMGMLFALVSSSLWVVTSIYSIGYMRGLNEHAQTRFFAFFALSLFAAVGVAFSANLLTMYLFYELLSFATYPLVTHHQDADSRASGRKYLTFIVGTSIGLVLPAMILVYNLTGTLDFQAAGAIGSLASPTLLIVLLAALLFGFAKAGLMPVHSWLPAAMVAPTPVSSLLHAVAVVKVGVFCIFRVVTGVFGPETLANLGLGGFITAVAAITMTVASLIALTQDGLKRRLAFSTIGQLSYIVLGAGLLNAAGMTGGLLHIAMHAFGKITLFFCAGAIFVATGEKYISKMSGIGRRMPLTMLAFFIGSLSIIGIPPTGGFLSKWNLLTGCMDGQHWVLAGVLIFSSLLNAAYFLPIVYRAFFCPPDQCLHSGPVKEAPLLCIVPPLITAGLSVAVFFYPDIFLTLARMAVAATLGV